MPRFRLRVTRDVIFLDFCLSSEATRTCTDLPVPALRTWDNNAKVYFNSTFFLWLVMRFQGSVTSFHFPGNLHMNKKGSPSLSAEVCDSFADNSSRAVPQDHNAYVSLCQSTKRNFPPQKQKRIICSEVIRLQFELEEKVETAIRGSGCDGRAIATKCVMVIPIQPFILQSITEKVSSFESLTVKTEAHFPSKRGNIFTSRLLREDKGFKLAHGFASKTWVVSSAPWTTFAAKLIQCVKVVFRKALNFERVMVIQVEFNGAVISKLLHISATSVVSSQLPRARGAADRAPSGPRAARSGDTHRPSGSSLPNWTRIGRV